MDRIKNAKNTVGQFFKFVASKDYGLALELTGRNNIRSLFDPPSSEYVSTSMEEKLEIILRLLRLGYDVGALREVGASQIVCAGHSPEEAHDVTRTAVTEILDHVLRTRFGLLDELANTVK